MGADDQASNSAFNQSSTSRKRGLCRTLTSSVDALQSSAVVTSQRPAKTCDSGPGSRGSLDGDTASFLEVLPPVHEVLIKPRSRQCETGVQCVTLPGFFCICSLPGHHSCYIRYKPQTVRVREAEPLSARGRQPRFPECADMSLRKLPEFSRRMRRVGVAAVTWRGAAKRRPNLPGAVDCSGQSGPAENPARDPRGACRAGRDKRLPIDQR